MVQDFIYKNRDRHLSALVLLLATPEEFALVNQNLTPLLSKLKVYLSLKYILKMLQARCSQIQTFYRLPGVHSQKQVSLIETLPTH